MGAILFRKALQAIIHELIDGVGDRARPVAAVVFEKEPRRLFDRMFPERIIDPLPLSKLQRVELVSEKTVLAVLLIEIGYKLVS